MAGFGDTLKNAILGTVPGDAANKSRNAMNGALNGHTTSGMDAAMQAHADKVHPVNNQGRMRLPSDNTDDFPK